MLLTDTACLFCLNPSTARLGLDKKGRPFFHCVGCGARSFLPSFSPCLNGVALLTPWVRAIVDEMTSSREHYEKYQRTIAAFLAQLNAQRMSVPTATDSPQPPQTITIPIKRPA
jgi:hypothetical protein